MTAFGRLQVDKLVQIFVGFSDRRTNATSTGRQKNCNTQDLPTTLRPPDGPRAQDEDRKMKTGRFESSDRRMENNSAFSVQTRPWSLACSPVTVGRRASRPRHTQAVLVN
jgi:hypothetical protein